MNSRGAFNTAGLLPFIPPIVLLMAIIGLATVAAPKDVAATTNAAATNGQVWYGLYTDATSYAPGDAIQIHASAPNTGTVFRLVRLDKDWTEITRTNQITVGPQSSSVGSFIEYPSLSLSGLISFTLEGWFHPTLLGGDTVVVAGQYGLTEAAAGIIISDTGQLGAYVSDTPQTDLSRLALASPPADFELWLDSWHHLAMTYDSDAAQVILYVDGIVAAQRAQSGKVAEVAAPFRLGARSEAPGDLTGVLDGRLDSWAVWPEALTEDEIKDRMQLGLTTANPAPDPAEVALYVSFDDAYPGIGDSSANAYTGTVYNHGNPGVSGVYTETGRAFRLNHDQIVDAGWDVTTVITIPAGTPSGMYAIQALLDPFAPTQAGDRLSVRAIAIRPVEDGPHASIAVVMPTNTWTSYTRWPEKYGPSVVSERSRYPGTTPIGGGNNSAYGEMGDGVSMSYFHGWQRPSNESSPIKPALHGGYSVRAPNTMYLVRWLDVMGYDYDVYSDDDFDAGLITAANHRVLMPNSHHEYWSDGMLETMTAFLDAGGSVVAPAGNIFTWRVMYGTNRVIEVRKFGQAPVLGVADLQSGIDGSFLGTLRQASLCNGNRDVYHGYPQYKALGVMIHITSPCDNKPNCFGKWAALNTGHWLWQGSGLSDDERFGFGRVPDSYAVGHEADTWVEGMPLPGLADGQQAVILAEGTDFDPVDPAKGSAGLDGHPNMPPASCQENVMSLIGQGPGDSGVRIPIPRGGTILYFPHSGGGHVLVIGASATPWALASDAALSGLLERGLNCFVYGEGCGYDVFLPAVLKGAS